MLSIREQIFDQIDKADNCLIALSGEASGDSLAGALALKLYLKKLGNKAELISENRESAKELSFLPGYEEISSSPANLRKFIVSVSTKNAAIEQVKYAKTEKGVDFILVPKSGSLSESDISSRPGDYKYSLIIAVGLTDLDLLGKYYRDNLDFFYSTPLINIDNDPGNEEFGQINHLEITASSVSEMLFALLKENDAALIDEDIATCLLAGLISGTKRFRSANITPQALEAAAQLIGLNARLEEINNALYRAISIAALKLWGRALARLSSLKNEALVWSILKYGDFVATGSEKDELPQIINELIANLPQAKIAVLFHEEAPNRPYKSSALIHSFKNIGAEKVLSKFDPAQIAGGRLMIESRLKVEDLSAQVISALERHIIKAGL